MTLSSGLTALLEWLTELRKIVYLQDYLFVIKGKNKEEANEEIHGTRYVGRDMGLHAF